MTKRKRLVLTLVVLVFFLGWMAWGNLTLETTRYDLYLEGLPDFFEGLRVVQISDLHNAVYGKENARLLEAIRQTAPDLILFTGDMVDSRNTRPDLALDLAEQAAAVAPCYYVPGNHEGRLDEDEYAAFEKGLMDRGVIPLHNQGLPYTRGEESIWIMGVEDPRFGVREKGETETETLRRRIDQALDGGEGLFTLLLSHRPEQISLYGEENLGLVFSGHAHGGQFRLPLVGGLAAPDQGLFPQYDAGVFRQESTTMVVSRGVGNSIIPVRFNNRPQLVLAVLHTQS